VGRNMFADLDGGVKTGEAKEDGGPVALEEDSCEVVMLLNHVYAGAQWKLLTEHIGGCLRLAAKYDLPRLLEACHTYLQTAPRLKVSNLPAWLEAACDYQVPSFTAQCVDFAAGNLQGIIDYRYCCPDFCSCSSSCAGASGPRVQAELCAQHETASGCTACRVEKQLPATDWLERLPPSMISTSWWRSCSCAHVSWLRFTWANG
jgi:hypothetical protein